MLGVSVFWMTKDYCGADVTVCFQYRRGSQDHQELNTCSSMTMEICITIINIIMSEVVYNVNFYLISTHGEIFAHVLVTVDIHVFGNHS